MRTIEKELIKQVRNTLKTIRWIKYQMYIINKRLRFYSAHIQAFLIISKVMTR